MVQPCLKNTEVRSVITGRCIDVRKKTFMDRDLPHLITHGMMDLLHKRDRAKVHRFHPGKVMEDVVAPVIPIAPPLAPPPPVVPIDATIGRVLPRLNLKKILATRAYPYLTKRHKECCEKPQECTWEDKVFPVVTRKSTFMFPVLSFEDLHGKYHEYLNLRVASEIPYKIRINEITTTSSSAAVKRFEGIDTADWVVWTSAEAREWLLGYYKWVLTLPIQKLFAVIAYTFHSFDYVNLYLYEKSIRIPIEDRGSIRHMRSFLGNSQMCGLYFYCRQNSAETHPQFVRRLRTMKDKTIERGYEAWIADMDAVFREAPPLRFPMVLFRGLPQGYATDTSPGNIHRETTFVSTSIDPFYATARGGNPTRGYALMRISVPAKTRVLLLGAISFYPRENEVVLHRNTRLFVQTNRGVTVPRTEKALQQSIRKNSKCPKPQIVQRHLVRAVVV